MLVLLATDFTGFVCVCMLDTRILESCGDRSGIECLGGLKYILTNVHTYRYTHIFTWVDISTTASSRVMTLVSGVANASIFLTPGESHGEPVAWGSEGLS